MPIEPPHTSFSRLSPKSKVGHHIHPFSNRKKWILFSITIALTIALGLLFLPHKKVSKSKNRLQQQTSSSFLSTDTWEFYEEDLPQYEFQYPSEWYTYTLPLPSTDSLSTVFSNEKITSVYGLSKNGIIIALVKNAEPTFSSGTRITVDGAKAQKHEANLTATNNSGIWWDEVVIPDKKISFRLIATDPNTLKSYRKTFETLLSTFTSNLPTPTPPSPPLDETEIFKIEQWITQNNLNKYGDPKDTIYAGGTPLFDESTGDYRNKYDYIMEKHPDRPWDQSN